MKIALSAVLSMLEHTAIGRDANTLAVEFSDEVGHRLELRIAEVVDDVMVVQFRQPKPRQ